MKSSRDIFLQNLVALMLLARKELGFSDFELEAFLQIAKKRVESA